MELVTDKLVHYALETLKSAVEAKTEESKQVFSEMCVQFLSIVVWGPGDDLRYLSDGSWKQNALELIRADRTFSLVGSSLLL